MNIEVELMREHSRVNAQRVIDYVAADVNRFEELMQLFLGGNYRTAQRSVWVVSYCVENYPFLIEPYWPRLMEVVQRPDANESVVRNVVRMWQFVDAPEEYEGFMIDFCIQNLTNTRTPTATKAFSISVLEKLVKKYPDLTEEVAVILESRLLYELPSFQSRAKRFLAQKSTRI